MLGTGAMLILCLCGQQGQHQIPDTVDCSRPASFADETLASCTERYACVCHRSAAFLGVLLAGWYSMQGLRAQYKYIHTPDRQWKQLAKIPGVFPDLTPTELARP